MFKEGLNHF